MNPQTGFFHSVYFYLHPGSDADTARRLADACQRDLSGIPGVLRLTVGFPAGTDLLPVDNAYGVALLIEFADKAAHDVYDAHPEHQRFVATNRSLFSRVQVFDVAPANS